MTSSSSSHIHSQADSFSSPSRSPSSFSSPSSSSSKSSFGYSSAGGTGEPLDLIILSVFGRGLDVAEQLIRRQQEAQQLYDLLLLQQMQQLQHTQQAQISTSLPPPPPQQPPRPWRIAVIELTEALGGAQWDDADWVGPWGLLETPECAQNSAQDPIVKQCVENWKAAAQEQSRGWTFLMHDGPWELRGPMADWMLKQRERKLREQKHLWPSYFSFEYASLLHRHISDSHVRAWASQGRAGGVLPFRHMHSPYWFLPSPKKRLAQRLNQLEQNGVQVLRASRLEDIRLRRGGTRSWVDAIEVRSAITRSVGVRGGGSSGGSGSAGGGAHNGVHSHGVMQAKSFMITFSSQESQAFPAQVSKVLFPSGAPQPTWFWARFSMTLANKQKFAPERWALVVDPDLPLTHTNLIYCSRSHSLQSLHSSDSASALSIEEKKQQEILPWDFWLKLPLQAFSDAVYRQKIQDELCRILSSRFPFSEPSPITHPSTSSSSSSSSSNSSSNSSAATQSASARVVIPRFPVYEDQDLDRLKRCRAHNLIFDGPEVTKSYEPRLELLRVAKIVQQLEKMKKDWEKKEHILLQAQQKKSVDCANSNAI